MPTKRIRQLYRRHPRASRIIIGCVLAISAGIATPFLLYRTNSPTTTAINGQQIPAATNQPTNGELQKGTPTYDTVLPTGKTIEDFGGWTRVSPPNRDPVYAYVDKIGAIPINVSQQPLPKEFSDQPAEQTELLARGYAANKKLQVGDAIAWVGTSAKGPQSVIVVKNKLLILIKASAAISDSEWEKYIQSLS